MTYEELRRHFVIEDLFKEDTLQLTYWEVDRTIIGSAVPVSAPVELKVKSNRELASNYFLERREIGILNIGGEGSVHINGTVYPLKKLDSLYIGRGQDNVSFHSQDAAQPAHFYLLSYPAHASHPVSSVGLQNSNILELGTQATANQRRIVQQIYEAGTKSCQLVMGYTELKPGSVWNTMPPHTHVRRSEVYMYFDVHCDHAVFHLMGKPDSIRTVVMKNRQVVLSPPWSIHSGCGTSSYRFSWGMGGENQAFADMDAIALKDL